MLNLHAAAGTVNQNYANILLMLLCLRQACGHPFLVKDYNSDSVGKVSVEMAKRVPRDMLINLLDCLEMSFAICHVCNDPPEDPFVTIMSTIHLKSELFLRFWRQIVKCIVPWNATEVLCLLKRNLQRIAQVLVLQAHNSYSETPDEGPIKTIIFSQWTSMLDLVETSLSESCIQYTRLDGTMTLGARDRAVKDFNTDPENWADLSSYCNTNHYQGHSGRQDISTPGRGEKWLHLLLVKTKVAELQLA
ncbi:hypothetical protein SO802_028409 [Lithocarpus litseifolius]|uniref:Helicase C-terminal domain-containing protein n=1 Tax=Lithocarpus litseifolius TaxID=425828 RepID=A0AAW2BVN6_9ROSI